MSEKLKTKLQHFRFDKTIQKGIYTIEWFKYSLEDIEDNISGFTREELNQFERWILANDFNFGGGKDYHLILNEDEIPIEDIDDLVPNERLNFPECLIIKPESKMERTNGLCNFMKIVLTDKSGRDNHAYDLPFGVIGKIVGKS